MAFHDHFSDKAEGYARYRPRYPDALFGWLAALTPQQRLAWDCATGNGQAAVGLAARFTRVVATDASADQLRYAIAAPNVEYRQAGAGDSGLPAGSVDLVTCAQAVHWLPRADFYREARRVLVGGGLIAVWGYHIPLLRDPRIDHEIRHFHDTVVGPYWPPERKLVLDRLATIEFPFAEVEAPGFGMTCEWTLADFARYLGTQSATGRYRDSTRADPVPAFVAAVESAWGGQTVARPVHFPLFLRVGRS